MKNKSNKITNGEVAKFSLLLLVTLIFLIGTACSGSFSTGNSNTVTTNKVDDNRKTNVSSTENSVGNVETSNSNSNSEISNVNSAEKTDEKVEKADASTGEVPSEAQLQAMTKETLLDFNDAVKKGDFTDFQSKISALWKKSASPEKFNQGFKEFIDKKIDMSNIKDENATFDPAPAITKKGGYDVLTVNGKYDTSPLPVRFFTEYVNEEGNWKLISIKVDTRKNN